MPVKSKRMLVISAIVLAVLILGTAIALPAMTKKFTVDWDVAGTITSEKYKRGELPSFKGSTDREGTEDTKYTFIGWDKEIVPVTEDITYTAVYSFMERVEGKLLQGFGSYTGWLENGLPVGEGKLVSESGWTYEGTFENGAEITGSGKMVFPNGDYYEGTFESETLKKGKGRITFPSNDVFEGDMEDGMMQGKGRLLYNSGDVYEGDFNHGVREGNGKLTYVNTMTYEGQWKDDAFNGQGVFDWKNGCTYTGTFTNGAITGTGTFVWDFPEFYNYYVGPVVDAVANGQGEKHWGREGTNENYWRGTFENGEPKRGTYGFGRMDGKEGDIWINPDTGAWSWYNGQTPAATGNRGGGGGGGFTGKGKIEFPSGDVYEGDLVKGVMQGKGVLKYASGDVYEGDFAHGVREGNGKLTYANGMTYEGQWKDDAFNGNGVFDWKNGCTYTGTFTKGKITGSGTFVWDFPEFYNYYVGPVVDGVANGEGEKHWGRPDSGENYWKGTFENGDPKKGTYGYGRMDGTEGYIWIDAETGGWSWYTGQLENGDYVVNGQMTGVLPDGRVVIDGKLANGSNISFTYPDGTAYVGDYADGRRNGEGKLTYTSGDVYEGNFANDQRSGNGKLTYANSMTYEGEWANDAFHGQGVFDWKNGCTYTGEFTNGAFTGQATFVWDFGADYSYYTGAMVDNQANGEGEKHWGRPNTGENYWKGTFENGDPKKGTYGYGRMDGTEGYIWVDAETGAWSWYTGQLENGDYVVNGQMTGVLPDGRVVIDGKLANGSNISFTYPDGTAYVGDYADGRRNGEGKLTYTSGDVYEGNFANDQRSGNGKLTYANSMTYEGEWANDAFHGQGVFDWKNGCTYTGQFTNGAFTGQATFVWDFGADYSYYTGAMVDNQANGEGEKHFGRPNTGENYWKGTFEGGNPKKGTYGYGRMDGTEGYIWVDAETGGWSWYNGQLENGDYVVNGQTTGILSDGRVVIDGKLANGSNISFTYPDGTAYVGDYADGRRNGAGKLTYTSGDVYEGDFVNDQRSGNGKLTYANTMTYEGEWANDAFHGQGVFDWKNGCTYTGEFTNGAFTGQATFVWDFGADYSYYTGAMVDNQANGEGEKHFGRPNTGENYWKGTFEGGNPKKGTYGYGRMDGTEGYIWVDAETGGWSWYNGQLENGDTVVNGQIVSAGEDGRVYINGVLANGSNISYTYPDGTIYVGGYVDGRRNGTGTLTYPSGDVYEGDFVNDQRSGNGKLTYSNGMTYEGEWANDVFHGQGVFDWKNGCTYIGEFTNGAFTGQATFVWDFGADYSYYTGAMVDNQANGEGEKHFGREGTGENYWKGTFEGGNPKKGTLGYGRMDGTEGYIWVDADTGAWSWYSGVLDGKHYANGQLMNGTGLSFTYDNGDSYTGDFVDGLRVGNGKLTYANGMTYEGEWANNAFHGQGVFDWKNGCTYTGQFTNGAFTGQATFVWDFGADYSYYTGAMVDNQANGEGEKHFGRPNTGENYWKGTFEGGNPKKGTYGYGRMDGTEGYIWVDAETGAWSWYSGVFEGKHYANGQLMNGTGLSFTYDNGDSYTGDFVDGLRVGNGKLTYANGMTYEGEWADNAFHGQGVFDWKNGCTYTGQFTNGAFTGQATFVWDFGADYSYYTGAMVDNQANGEGEKHFGRPNTGENYWKGTFEGGNPKKGTYGYGRMDGTEGYIWVDASSGAWSWYTGISDGKHFINGQIANGSNLTYTYESGDSYTGDFVNGQRSGNGKLTYANGCSYDGQWANDAFHGQGVFDWNNGCTYTGQFTNGEFTGQATFVWSDGSYYVGHMVGNLANGQGEKHWGPSGTGENYWKGTFEGGNPKKGTYGYGRMDGTEGYIWVDAGSGAWSWYNGDLENGTHIVNGQPAMMSAAPAARGLQSAMAPDSTDTGLTPEKEDLEEKNTDDPENEKKESEDVPAQPMKENGDTTEDSMNEKAENQDADVAKPESEKTAEEKNDSKDDQKDAREDTSVEGTDKSLPEQKAEDNPSDQETDKKDSDEQNPSETVDSTAEDQENDAGATAPAGNEDEQ